MSVAEPDPFDSIVEGLDLEEPDDDIVSLRDLNDAELLNKFEECREALLEMGEMLSDTEQSLGGAASTPEGRELHSTRAACLIEMRRRGMR